VQQLLPTQADDQRTGLSQFAVDDIDNLVAASLMIGFAFAADQQDNGSKREPRY